MEIYKWTFKPKSSVITPWTSDIIWGHIIWSIKDIYGEEKFLEKLQLFKDNKSPFIVSDAFPSGKLPILKHTFYDEKISKEDILTYSRAINYLENIEFVDIEVFNEMRNGLDFSKLCSEFLDCKRNPKTLKKQNLNINLEQLTKRIRHENHEYKESFQTIKNSINRLTNTTDKENSLFHNEEVMYKTNLDVYFKIDKSQDIDEIKNCIDYIEASGYGKKASTGKGQIQTISFEKFDKFLDVNGNKFIVLSNYIPKSVDYEEVIYAKTQSKIGKIGRSSENIFKNPYIFYKSGSMFIGKFTNSKGKMLSGIHSNPDIVQYGIPFVLGVK